MKVSTSILDPTRQCKTKPGLVSMVDGRFFGTLSSIAQRLRDNTLPFGGIQVGLDCRPTHNFEPMLSFTVGHHGRFFPTTPGHYTRD